MSDQRLFKCRILYGFDASALPLENRIAFLDKLLDVRLWLREHKLSNHLINSYDNGEDGALFVFSNRDTAIMLKLAMA